jgi:hypothetical protein
MIESSQPELYTEPKRSAGPMLLAGLAALLITGLVLTGYALLRKRHAEGSGSLASSKATTTTPTQQRPKALVIVDEAMLQGGLTTIGGAVRNTSTEKLQDLSVELELKRRNDATTEIKLIPLSPAVLEPQQEGRYALQVKSQDYSSAHLSGLTTGSSSRLVYATAQGQKRPLERLDQKTIVVGKRPSKGGEFLNSPDKPTRVP